jgi:hypothetical protein
LGHGFTGFSPGGPEVRQSIRVMGGHDRGNFLPHGGQEAEKTGRGWGQALSFQDTPQ